jgi:mannan endo-1,4-beta-mannosidase
MKSFESILFNPLRTTARYAWLVTLAVLAGCSKDGDADNANTPEDTTPPAPEAVTLTAANAPDYMVDAKATRETVALFYNLKTLSQTKFAVGQQDAFNRFYKNDNAQSDIKKTTGSDPALLGSDFIFITDKSNDGKPDNWFYQQEVNTIKQVQEAYALGMINIFSWHVREPYQEKSFYTSEMSAGDKAKAFKSILPGNENHDWYKKKLDKVASVFNNLKDADGKLIPVIFRPFHEYDGSWFWWGAEFCTADEFKTAFRFTVDYLRDTKGVHNVLYSLGPDNSYDTKEKYLTRYPGDKYVDVLGMDNYGDLRSGTGQTGANLANKKLKVVSDLAKEKVKIAALTETGYQVTATNPPVEGWFSQYVYHTLTANDLEIAFVMFWGNSQDSYFVPAATCPNAADFKTFTDKPEALLQNEIPDLYK